MNNALEHGIRYITSRTVNKNDAVMFDIDDTLIRFNGISIPEMISLFHICKAKKYKMIIITARPHHDENIEYTQNQLLNNGIVADKLVFSKPELKTLTKQLLGHTFILSVGDQYTDLGGSLNWIKLPDMIDKNIYTNNITK